MKSKLAVLVAVIGISAATFVFAQDSMGTDNAMKADTSVNNAAMEGNLEDAPMDAAPDAMNEDSNSQADAPEANTNSQASTAPATY